MLLLSVVFSSPLVANALSLPGLIGPVRWQPGATVNVYIPLDPLCNDPNTPRTRNVQVVQAVNLWQAALTQAGINLKLNPITLDASGNVPGTGKPPDTSQDTPSAGAINITWKQISGGERGTAEPSTQEEEGSKKAGPLVTDDVTLDNSATALPQKDDAVALSLALHELGHALGLAHSEESDSVMNENLSVVPKSAIGASDLREVKSVYAAASSSIDPTFSNLGNGTFGYTMTAHWLAGGEISIVQFLTNGAEIANVQLPPGWIEVTYPGISAPDVITFSIGPTDDLQAYLSQSNPSETFSFTSPAAPGETLAWAGDFVSVVAPTIPEPSDAFLCAAALLIFTRRGAKESAVR